MDEVRLTVRLSAADRRALKLHAVAQGRSIRDLVTGLIHAELAKGAPAPGDEPGGVRGRPVRTPRRRPDQPCAPSHPGVARRQRPTPAPVGIPPAAGAVIVVLRRGQLTDRVDRRRELLPVDDLLDRRPLFGHVDYHSGCGRVVGLVRLRLLQGFQQHRGCGGDHR